MLYNLYSAAYVAVIGGITSSGSATDRVDLFNLFTFQWEDGPRLPAALTGITALNDPQDRSLVVVGGRGGFVYRLENRDAQWSQVEGVQAEKGDRLYASALAVPDSALAGCRRDF